MSFAVILAFLNRYKKWFLYIGIGILILFLIFGIKSCFTKEVKINEEQIQKINDQNEARRKEELRKVIEENSEAIKTVDERNTISEATIEERSKAIEDKVKEVDQKIQESKSQGKDVTSKELECLLVPENCS